MKKTIILISILSTLLSFSQAQGNKTLGATTADSLDITHYHIYFNVPDIASQQITAHTILKLTTKVNGLNTVRLDLLALTIDSIFVASVKNTTYSYDDSTIIIPLSSTININDSIEIEVYYHGSPVTDPSGWGGYYFSGANYAYNLGVGFQDIPHNYGRVWFPCADNFTDRAFYDYYINCDTSKMAVCGGVLQSITQNGDSTHTVHWKMNQDIPTYIASMAVGDYTVVSDTIQLINGNTPIDIWVIPSLVSNVSGSFPNLDTILHIFENCFGPYLWDRVGYVGVPFNSGAMEHAMNIAYPNACINGSNTYQSLYAHELSHHWFGDLVTCISAEEMWINEGWASYTEALVEQVLNGENSYKNEIRLMHSPSVRYAHIEDGGFFALNNVPINNTYGTTSYDKGASIVHTLRYYMGDSLFFAGVKDFLNNFKFQEMSSAELRDQLTTSSGINMAEFFNTWVFTPGYPHFSIDSLTIISGPLPEYQTRVYMQQRQRGRNFYGNENIVEITFMDENWNSWSDTLKISGQYGYKDFLVPFNPSIAFCDYNEKICDATVDGYQIIKTTGTKSFSQTYCSAIINSVTDSALLRITHHWVTPDKANVPSSNIYRIHTSKFWKVEAINEQNINFSLKFIFNRSTATSGHLDTDFLTTSSSADSLVLLWREDNTKDWEIVNFYNIGSSTAGYLQTSNAKAGEYAFGIGEPNQSGYEENNHLEKLQIYPNPTNEKVKITTSITGKSEIKIIDINGKLVFSTILEKNNSSLTWDTRNQSPGLYEVILVQENIIANKKLIIY
jgi:Peptidase family M1 domain/Secretion system C-terminal sorting domain/Peptidase M1 N-terminal domain